MNPLIGKDNRSMMNRVISDGPDDFDDFINNHDKMQDEVYELEQLAEEAL